MLRKMLFTVILMTLLLMISLIFIRIQPLDFRLDLLKLKVLISAAKHGYVLNSLPVSTVTIEQLPQQLSEQRGEKFPEKFKGIWWSDGHPFGMVLIIPRSNRSTNYVISYKIENGIYSGDNVLKAFVFSLIRYDTEFFFHWKEDYQFASISADMDYPFKEVNVPAALFEGYQLDFKAPENATPQERHYMQRTGDYKDVCFCALRYVKDNLIIRENHGSAEKGYKLKRIIDGEGKKTSYHKEFTKAYQGKTLFKVNNNAKKAQH